MCLDYKPEWREITSFFPHSSVLARLFLKVAAVTDQQGCTNEEGAESSKMKEEKAIDGPKSAGGISWCFPLAFLSPIIPTAQ